MHDHHIYISAPLSSYFSSQLGRFQNLRRVFGEQFAPFTVKYIYIYIILPGLSRIGDLNRSYHLSLHVILLHCLMLTNVVKGARCTLGASILILPQAQGATKNVSPSEGKYAYV
ncbi:hypothetical protein V6Z11_D07G099300 [Gossypium hirsutum]